MEKKSKVSVLSSIKTKIILLIVLSVLATTTLCISRVISVVKENQTALVKNYMKDIALIAGEGIDRELGFADAATVLTAEELGNIIGSLRVEGMDSSYAYVVSDDGTMLYHPTADKIGQPVENDAVKQLLTEIGKGNRPESDVIIYDFKGIMKYASFYIGKNMDYIVVVTADEEEALESINVILKESALVSLITLVLCSVVGLLVAVRIVKPIERITEMTATLSELDFTRSSHQDYVDKRKDETGVMGRSMHVLRDKLTATVTSIATHSNDLYDASTAMNNSAEETALAIEQVEKAIAEIAQGATSQAQETQAATENVILMGNMIEETTEEVEILRDNARKMRDAGNKAIEIIGDLNSINQKTK
ncbi:MAG: HAMP domain-containing protein, partial [Lachnospiraceae bacterium]|nr:HAMP domain-containing protein [Lachnospiraceae bacterium]